MKLREDCEAHPVNVYGKHKLRAEQIVLNANKHNLVIRTSVSECVGFCSCP